jgi:hypothetical protein
MRKAQPVSLRTVPAPKACHPNISLLLPLTGWATTVLAFFPGSIDYDYGSTLKEAQTLSFGGHYSPQAAIVIYLLSHFGGFVAPVFMLKVTAAYIAVGFAMLHSNGFRQRLLIFLLTCGPVCILLTPSLRLSYVSLSFIALGLSLGLFGRARVSLGLAMAALFFASLFSTGFDVGYFFTIIAIVLGRNFKTGGNLRPSILRGLWLAVCLLAISKMVSFGLVAAFGAAHVDRSSTIYVSMLNDLAGIEALGVKTEVDPILGTTGRLS